MPTQLAKTQLIEALGEGLKGDLQRPAQLLEQYAELGSQHDSAAKRIDLKQLSQWHQQQMWMMGKALEWLESEPISEPQPVQLTPYIWEILRSCLPPEQVRAPVSEQPNAAALLDQKLMTPLIQQFIQESWHLRHAAPSASITQTAQTHYSLYLLPDARPHHRFEWQPLSLMGLLDAAHPHSVSLSYAHSMPDHQSLLVGSLPDSRSLAIQLQFPAALGQKQRF